MLIFARGRRVGELCKMAQRNALVLFSLSVSLSIVLGLVLYRVAVGSMTEPSQLGGALAVAKGIVFCTVSRFRFALMCS